MNLDIGELVHEREKNRVNGQAFFLHTTFAGDLQLTRICRVEAYEDTASSRGCDGKQDQ